jgi:GT2 family glycosyltransferase
VVVDNSAAEEPYTTVLGDETILRRENDGYVGGANAGLAWWLGEEACATELEVLVASHDAVVHPRALDAMIESLEQLPTFGAIGVGSGGAVAAAAPEGASWTVTPRPWVSGSLLLLRRAALEEVGLFDQRLESYVEDVDLCFRLWDSGWNVGALNSVHLLWNGSRSDAARRMMLRNWLLLGFKRRGWAGFLVVLAVELPPVVRSGTAAYMPWRSAKARLASRSRFNLLWCGLREGYQGRRRMRQPGHRPDGL